MTPVVFVCSPLMVATAKGSGNPAGWLVEGVRRQARMELTEDVSLVEAVGGDDCRRVSMGRSSVSQRQQAGELTRHAQVGLGREVGHGVCVSGASRGLNQVVGLSCRQDVKGPCTDRGAKWDGAGAPLSNEQHRLPVSLSAAPARAWTEGNAYGRRWMMQMRMRMRLRPSGCAPLRVLVRSCCCCCCCTCHGLQESSRARRG
jgi:hypothetical protein